MAAIGFFWHLAEANAEWFYFLTMVAYIAVGVWAVLRFTRKEL